jgi:hypothetical protein
LGGLAFALTPRGVSYGKFTFECIRCHEVITVERWQLAPPSWIPIAYPGMNRTTHSTAPRATTAPRVACSRHRYASSTYIRIATPGSDTPWWSMQSSPSPGPPYERVETYNGRPSTPQTAADIMKYLMSDNTDTPLTVGAAHNSDANADRP